MSCELLIGFVGSRATLYLVVPGCVFTHHLRLETSTYMTLNGLLLAMSSIDCCYLLRRALLAMLPLSVILTSRFNRIRFVGITAPSFFAELVSANQAEQRVSDRQHLSFAPPDPPWTLTSAESTTLVSTSTRRVYQRQILQRKMLRQNLRTSRIYI